MKPVAGSLADYLGLPLTENGITVSALPFRAYFRIIDDYYRDQDLTSRTTIGDDTSSGVQVLGQDAIIKGMNVRRCPWSKDYFTTARPWPQKGPGVSIPVFPESSAPMSVSITGNGAPTFKGYRSIPYLGSTVLPSADASSSTDKSMVSTSLKTQRKDNNSGDLLTSSIEWVDPKLKATISGGASGSIGNIDITALRESLALQRFQEKRALFGSRYEDYLRYVGVRPQDSRLQMPEYLGGSSQTIQFSEVLQTGGDQVGQLFGHGIAAMRTNRYRRFIPEHGYIMSMLLVRPIPVYTQGIDRMWTRKTKEDYWQKELQHIGQQEVLNREVYADGTDADNETFGYQNRYDEYRRGVNSVSGEFRTTQDYWHMGRIFSSRPALNSSFVTCHATDRIFQAQEQTSDQIYVMAQNNIIAKRLVDRNGNPI